MSTSSSFPSIQTAEPAQLREWMLLALLAALWGSSYLLIRIAVATIPPATLIALRVALAAVILAAVVRVRRERYPRDVRMWGLLLVQAVCNSIAAWTLLAWGQQFVPSGLAGVLNSTSPIFVVLIGALMGDRGPGGIGLAGALLGLAGVVLITGLDALAGAGASLAGQLAVLASAVLYGCAAINGRRFATLPPTVVAAATMILATAFLAPASVVIDRPWLLRPSLASIVAAVALAVFCTGVALLLYFRLVRTIGALGVASNSYLRAGVSVVLGIVVLGEPWTWTTGAGLAAIAAGVALINGAHGVRSAR